MVHIKLSLFVPPFHSFQLLILLPRIWVSSYAIIQRPIPHISVLRSTCIFHFLFNPLDTFISFHFFLFPMTNETNPCTPCSPLLKQSTFFDNEKTKKKPEIHSTVNVLLATRCRNTGWDLPEVQTS